MNIINSAPLPARGWGSAVGSGLDYLVENKINQMSRSKKMSEYSGLLQKSGIDARDADVLASHYVDNPQHFHQILEQYTPRQAQSQQDQNSPQYQQGLQQLGQPQQAQQQAYRQPTPEQAMQLQQLFKGLGQPQQEPSGLGEGVDLLTRSTKNELLKKAAPELEAEKAQKESSSRIQEKEAEKIARRHYRGAYPKNAFGAPYGQVPSPEVPVQQQLTPKEQAEKKRAQEEEKKKTEQQEKKVIAEQKKKAKEQTRKSLEELPKLNEKEQAAVNKSEKSYYDATLAKYEAGKKAEETMDKLEDLIDKGNLPYAWSYNLLDRLESSGKYIGKGGTGSIIAPVTGAISGVIVPTVGFIKDLQKGITAPDTEEYNKLSLSFIDGMKAIFGGKVSNDEMKAYLNLIPTLSQTDSGKKAIIKNMRSAVKADKLKYEAMRDIIRENGNKFPQTLGILVNERIDAELGKLADEAFDIPGLQLEESKQALAA